MLKVAALALVLTVPSAHVVRSAADPVPLVPNSVSATDTWKIDVSHSELSFSVRHILSKVRGQFTNWNGTIQADAKDWSSASVDITINASSINTNNERRDEHLKGADFFDAEKFPTITFKSTKIERKDKDVKVHGNLTMHGVTKPIVLTGKFLGMSKRQDGKLEAAFDASATINRTDFGMVWNRAVEGGMLVGEEITIDISIAATQQ